MKKLLILSGKGGTGKTTTAAAFINFFNCKAFADCDVDAPNLHIITKHDKNAKTRDYYGSQKSFIDTTKCINCGNCKENCRFNAIEKKEDYYKVNEFACEGCGVCQYICPTNAIKLIDDIAGKLMLYENNQLFSTAILRMGRGNSGKLVNEVKCQLPINKNNDIAVIDGSPGIGCPVIASISGVDMVLIVAEPSLSGISDMKRILKTTAIFKTKVAVCVNKYDISIENTNKIKSFCKDNNIDFLGVIPYDKKVSEAINEEKNIAEVSCPAKDSLYKIYEKVKLII